MNFLNYRLSIMTSPTFVDGGFVDLFWRNSNVTGGKVYPSRKVLHCNKIKSNYFVINVQNGEVPLSCPNEELRALGDTSCAMYFVSWPRIKNFKHGEWLVPKHIMV